MLKKAKNQPPYHEQVSSKNEMVRQRKLSDKKLVERKLAEKIKAGLI